MSLPGIERLPNSARSDWKAPPRESRGPQADFPACVAVRYLVRAVGRLLNMGLDVSRDSFHSRNNTSIQITSRTIYHLIPIFLCLALLLRRSTPDPRRLAQCD